MCDIPKNSYLGNSASRLYGLCTSLIFKVQISLIFALWEIVQVSLKAGARLWFSKCKVREKKLDLQICVLIFKNNARFFLFLWIYSLYLHPILISFYFFSLKAKSSEVGASCSNLFSLYKEIGDGNDRNLTTIFLSRMRDLENYFFWINEKQRMVACALFSWTQIGINWPSKSPCLGGLYLWDPRYLWLIKKEADLSDLSEMLAYKATQVASL